MKTRKIIIGVLAVLVGLGLLFGAGAAGYMLGTRQGYTLGVQSQLRDLQPRDGQPLPPQRGVPAPGYGYGMRPGFVPFAGGPYFGMRPHFGFFPFGMIGGIIGLFVLGLIFFGLLRLIFRPLWWGGMHGPWGWHGRPWGPPAGGPPWAQHHPEGEAPGKPAEPKSDQS